MNASAKKNKVLKINLEIKEPKKKSSLSKKSAENIPEIISTFFDNSLDAVIIGSQDDQIFTANPAACRMFAFSEKEICKLGRKGIVEQTPQLDEAVRKRKESGSFFGELMFIKKDGTHFPGEISSSVFTNSDGRQFTTLIIRDITERKKNERALHESELSAKHANELQQNIFEGSLDAIFISDEDSVLIAVNNAACDLTGYSKEQLLKMQIPDLHDEQDLEAYRKYHERIFMGEKILSEAKILRRDGIKVDAEFNNSRISISGKYYMHTSVRDITERKKADAAIKESESRYRSLFENSPIGISATGMSGEILQVNLPFARMYGFDSVTQMLAELKNVNQLFANPKDRAKIIKVLKQNGKIDAQEFEVIKRDGTRFFALSSGVEIRDIEGNLLYYQATHIDLTERKKIEEKIHSASLYARTLIEASLDPLVTISAEGKITDVNSSTEKNTGFPRNKLIGSDFSDYFTDPDKARIGYKIAFSKGEVKDYPLTLRHHDGRTTDVLYNATLFKNEAGEVQGVFAAARDITKLKQIEVELRKSKKMLEKLNQHLLEVRENERNEIALNLHDDLGQKLTAINLDIAWLKSRIGVQSKTVREKIEEMSSMIRETIESIKETSALLRPAILFDLGLVPAIKSQLGSFEKQTGIKCKFYFRPEEFVLEDRFSLILYRILQESLTNIARHSGASKADINLYVLRNKIELIIKDDGYGIEKNKVNSLKSLGIAGIKERVNSVNGKMNIVSTDGSGTMICVEIPLLRVKTNL